MNTSEIIKTVSDYLQATGVSFDVVYIGATKQEEWECDQWQATFIKGSVKEQFQYHTGKGLRYKGKPVAPEAASVLYGLLLDATATEQCFSDWCADYGYNDDSIKDFRIYEACCDTGKQLRKLFTSKQQEELREMLQDF